jgi:L-amino acid N-acyltransferase YncA
MALEIIKTLPGDSNFHWFEDLPKLLYPNHSIRFKQSDSLNLEFLINCFVLLENGAVKARLALYHNPNLAYQNKNAWCLGNYESVDDQKVSKALFDKVFAEAKSLNAEFIIGPMNGSTWDNYRFSEHHQTPNFLLEPYHHLYYNQQFKNAGFIPIAKYTSSYDSKIQFDDAKILNRAIQINNLGVKIRPINLNCLEEELSNLYPFVKEAFQKNFLYTPISLESFKNKYLEAAKIMDSDYVLIAEDSSNQIIGFLFAYRDLFDTTNKTLVVKTVARNPENQWAGLGQVIGNQVVKTAAENGFTRLIHAFMIEEASSTKLSQAFLGKIYKNYVLYGKEI